MTNSAPTTPAVPALFVSDLHLDAALPRTTARFLRFLDETAPTAQALYLLGDIFEYWAGDDDLDNESDRSGEFNRSIVAALRRTRDRGVEISWIAGNRDFLVGEGFAARSGLHLLGDPTVLTLAGKRIAVTHGDALCTDDHAYVEFRAQVRQPGWQQQFLAQPLAQRKLIIENMRLQSRAAQRDKPAEIMDVNEAAVQALFVKTAADVIVHGHTHRPHAHRYADGRVRLVLPDWDLDHGLHRGGWLQLDHAGQFTALAA